MKTVDGDIYERNVILVHKQNMYRCWIRISGWEEDMHSKFQLWNYKREPKNPLRRIEPEQYVLSNLL